MDSHFDIEIAIRKASCMYVYYISTYSIHVHYIYVYIYIYIYTTTTTTTNNNNNNNEFASKRLGAVVQLHARGQRHLVPEGDAVEHAVL